MLDDKPEDTVTFSGENFSCEALNFAFVLIIHFLVCFYSPQAGLALVYKSTSVGITSI